jgi:hypothetical protein
MQFFVRTMEKHKASTGAFCAEVVCSGLSHAKAEAKRRVMQSTPEQMLQADACLRNGGHVRTKYRCHLDQQGDFHEYVLG